MLEMLFTIIAALSAAIYGLSQSIFMVGKYKHMYRAGLAIILIVTFLVIRIRRNKRNARIMKLGVNLSDYLYYEKYTSILYRIGYFLSYLIQNIKFDYTYMKRNFNFCRGLDVYNGGVAEYYIKFRNTWYRYLNLTLLRHRVSLKKLQTFACNMKNEMILHEIKDETLKENYREFDRAALEYFTEYGNLPKSALNHFPNTDLIQEMYIKNTLKAYKSLSYSKKHEPKIVTMVKQQELRSHKDVNDYKKMNL